MTYKKLSKATGIVLRDLRNSKKEIKYLQTRYTLAWINNKKISSSKFKESQKKWDKALSKYAKSFNTCSSFAFKAVAKAKRYKGTYDSYHRTNEIKI